MSKQPITHTIKSKPVLQMDPYPFDVQIVEMVLNELYSGSEVGLVKLVRNVPANWTKLASLLQYDNIILLLAFLASGNILINYCTCI